MRIEIKGEECEGKTLLANVIRFLLDGYYDVQIRNDRLEKIDRSIFDNIRESTVDLYTHTENLNEGRTGINVEEAMKTLKEAFQEDPEYAHGWHCNIAMACKDAGSDHEVGNEAATRFMRQLFDVETSNDMLS